MTCADQDAAQEENEKRHKRGKFRRVPVGRVARPDKTDEALAKRELVEMLPAPPGEAEDKALIVVTEKGRALLNARH